MKSYASQIIERDSKMENAQVAQSAGCTKSADTGQTNESARICAESARSRETGNIKEGTETQDKDKDRNKRV